MDATQPIERERRPGFATCVLTGAGLGWIALPALVLAAAVAHGRSGSDWIAPALAGGIVAAGTGLLIGVMRLGWAGLIGAVGGAIAGAALPYVAIPPLLGLTAWGIGVYGDYLPGIVAAAAVAGVARSIGARSGLRVAIRPVAIVVVGLVVFALWFGFWFVVAPSLGRLV